MRRYFVIDMRVAVYIAIFSSTAVLVSGQQSMSSDLAQIYKSKQCENEPTCFLFNSANVPKNENTLESQKCNCDEDCVKYKDCCVDADKYKTENQLPPLPYCSPTKKIYMTVKCSETWPSDDTKQKCEKSTLPLEDDMTLVTPVTNIESSVTYGNVYCAMCNYDFNMMNNIYETWNITARCGILPIGIRPPPLVVNRSRHDMLSPRTCLSSDVPRNMYLPPDSSCQYEIKMDFPFADGFDARKWSNWQQTKPGFFVLDINLYLYESGAANDGYNEVVSSNIPVTINVPAGGLTNVPVTRNKRFANSWNVDLNEYAEESEKIAMNVIYDPESKNWFSRYNGEDFVCYFDSNFAPESEFDVRKCVPNVVSECASFEHEAFVRGCHTRTALIYDTATGVVYRNIDCARCNNVFQNIEYCQPSSFVPLSSFASTPQQSEDVEQDFSSQKFNRNQL